MLFVGYVTGKHHAGNGADGLFGGLSLTNFLFEIGKGFDKEEWGYDRQVKVVKKDGLVTLKL
jgi:hypothetical protein